MTFFALAKPVRSYSGLPLTVFQDPTSRTIHHYFSNIYRIIKIDKEVDEHFRFYFLLFKAKYNPCRLHPSSLAISVILYPCSFSLIISSAWIFASLPPILTPLALAACIPRIIFSLIFTLSISAIPNNTLAMSFPTALLKSNC